MQKYCFNCMNPLGKSPFCGHCGKDSRIEAPSVPYHLPCGTVLSERYVVGRVLGEGGFGITYMGMDTKLSKRVAVKEFYPLGIASRDCAVSANVIVPEDQEEFFVNGVDRFLVEARSVAKFADEDGIVGVQDTFTENNTAYIVMDYLDGENLKQYVDNHGTLSFDAVMRLLVPVMKALKDMHAKGVIHRDISPDNIMYTPIPMYMPCAPPSITALRARFPFPHASVSPTTRCPIPRSWGRIYAPAVKRRSCVVWQCVPKTVFPT